MKSVIDAVINKFSHGFILLYILFFSCVVAIRKKVESDRVLLVEGGHMGDAIVDASAVEALVRIYREQGKEVFVMCSKQTRNSLCLFSFAKTLRFIGSVPDRAWRAKDVIYLHNETGKHKFDAVIGLTSGTYLLWYAAGCTAAAQKYFLVEPERMKGSFGRIFRLLCRMQNAQVVVGDGETSRAQWLERYLSRVGAPGYQYAIAHIDKQCDIEKLPGKYISIVIDSADAWKRWPMERFMELAHTLLDTYSYDICFLGTDKSDSIHSLIESDLAQAKDRVHDLIGRTSIAEWIEWIRGSECLIGVDSGSIHVAASVGTVSICLNGWWHGKRFLPYHISRSTKDTVVPICVSEDCDIAPLHECKNCASDRYVGYANEACLKQIKNGGPCFCLERIKTGDVLRAMWIE